MSEFFHDIHGSLQGPLGSFNQGAALPPRDVGDSMFGGMVGAFNNGSELLGGQVTPYSMDTSFSSELSFLNIAHSIQKVIQAIIIPEAHEHNGSFRLCHTVSYGGLAFSLRIPRNSVREMIDNSSSAERAGLAPEAFVNLAVVNYLLHGLQRYGFSDDAASAAGAGPGRDAWQLFYRSLKMPKGIFPTKAARRTREVKLRIAMWLQEHWLRCFGVVHASDKQGGQHQSNSNPIVTWAVDFVVNMVVDGKVQNMTNIWRHLNVNAGDDLILRLRYVPTTDYTLVAYPKNLTRKTFPAFSGHDGDDGVWQLVPDIFDAVFRDPLDVTEGAMRMARPTEDPAVFDYREQGFWHVARSHAYWGRMPVDDIRGNDELQYNGNGALLQATFAPEFMDPLRGDLDTTYSSIMGLESEEDALERQYREVFGTHAKTMMTVAGRRVSKLGTHVGLNTTQIANAVVRAGLVDSVRHFKALLAAQLEAVHNNHREREIPRLQVVRKMREDRLRAADVKDAHGVRVDVMRCRDERLLLPALQDCLGLKDLIDGNQGVYWRLRELCESAARAAEDAFGPLASPPAPAGVDRANPARVLVFEDTAARLDTVLKHHVAFFRRPGTVGGTFEWGLRDGVADIAAELNKAAYKVSTAALGPVHFADGMPAVVVVAAAAVAVPDPQAAVAAAAAEPPPPPPPQAAAVAEPRGRKRPPAA